MIKTQVNLQKLNSIFDKQVLQGIKYRLGGKAPSLNSSPPALESGIDCSGIVRLLLFQSTDGALKIPDGSWNQKDWCQENLEKVPYSRALSPEQNELFIAFITPRVNGAGKIGHVWLIAQRDGDKMGETMESYGGHGIGSRNANTGVLTRLVSACYRIPTVEKNKSLSQSGSNVEPLIIVWNGNQMSISDLISRGGHEVEKVTEDLSRSRIYVNSHPRGR